VGRFIITFLEIYH